MKPTFSHSADAMVDDYTTVAMPTIDAISNDTFEYSKLPHLTIEGTTDGYASRGIFNFKFEYKHLPIYIHNFPSKPFETPIMAGNVFAITAQYFWELGAYDAGMQLYGE